jgi:hypothetical protein
MQGVLIRWSDPPAPEQLKGIKSTLGHYHAGDAPNDRCYAAPLIDVDRINWPHKVYVNSQIIMMTRSRFIQLAA